MQFDVIDISRQAYRVLQISLKSSQTEIQAPVLARHNFTGNRKWPYWGSAGYPAQAGRPQPWLSLPFYLSVSLRLSVCLEVG